MKQQSSVKGNAFWKVGGIVSSVSAVFIVKIGLLALLSDKFGLTIKYMEKE